VFFFLCLVIILLVAAFLCHIKTLLLTVFCWSMKKFNTSRSYGSPDNCPSYYNIEVLRICLLLPSKIKGESLPIESSKSSAPFGALQYFFVKEFLTFHHYKIFNVFKDSQICFLTVHHGRDRVSSELQ
jgi:hypothetical protein